MKKYIYNLLLLLICCNLSLSSNDLPDRPSPPRLVNDFTNLLSAEEALNLERKLVDFNRQTSTQIAIIIVNDLLGYDRAEYTYGIGEKWGVGQKGKDNGIVIMVKPKTPTSGGQTFIAPGYGLEAVVPDAIAKRIMENEMIPEFKANNYYASKGFEYFEVINAVTGYPNLPSLDVLSEIASTLVSKLEQICLESTNGPV